MVIETNQALIKAIVKVQFGVFTTDEDAPLQIMVYTEKRQGICFQYAADNVISAINGDLKGYFEAEYLPGRWIIGRRVEDQPW